ncbi:MAG: DUF1919 domain-containing protein [Selenomonadaceae bacterium]|nr:DUF1919 domain-containing protein [Selenomonadaceae bacterium]
MKKVLLWFFSNDGKFLNSAAEILERQHNGLEVIGVTASVPISLQRYGKNVSFIPLDKVTAIEFDILLVVGAKNIGMSKVTKVAGQLKFPEEKLLGDWIVCIPGFTLEKYRKLQRSRLSIFSVNCFGGFISNTFALPFRSPFVNLYLNDEDFIKFLRAPHVYMEEKPAYQCQKLDSTGTIEFPVASIGNISLNMLHYKIFEEAFEVWERRKSRINWYNLFVVMWTENAEIAQEFDSLPYGKKICFVPFKSDLDSAWYINPEINKNWSRFVDKFNDFAKGIPFYYDPFDMLLYGKKTPLIEM